MAAISGPIPASSRGWMLPSQSNVNRGPSPNCISTLFLDFDIVRFCALFLGESLISLSSGCFWFSQVFKRSTPNTCGTVSEGDQSPRPLTPRGTVSDSLTHMLVNTWRSLLGPSLQCISTVFCSVFFSFFCLFLKAWICLRLGWEWFCLNPSFPDTFMIKVICFCFDISCDVLITLVLWCFHIWLDLYDDILSYMSVVCPPLTLVFSDERSWHSFITLAYWQVVVLHLCWVVPQRCELAGLPKMQSCISVSLFSFFLYPLQIQVWFIFASHLEDYFYCLIWKVQSPHLEGFLLPYLEDYLASSGGLSFASSWGLSSFGCC